MNKVNTKQRQKKDLVNEVSAVKVIKRRATTKGQIITDGERYYVAKVTQQPVREATGHTQQMDQCMILLGKSYELYLGYLELDFEEAAARQEANLSDDLKYTMAYCAWKQQGN